jgi:hypothetical protein
MLDFVGDLFGALKSLHAGLRPIAFEKASLGGSGMELRQGSLMVL